MSTRSRSPDGKSQKERIKEITEQLEAGVTAVFESDAYKASQMGRSLQRCPYIL